MGWGRWTPLPGGGGRAPGANFWPEVLFKIFGRLSVGFGRAGGWVDLRGIYPGIWIVPHRFALLGKSSQMQPRSSDVASHGVLWPQPRRQAHLAAQCHRMTFSLCLSRDKTPGYRASQAPVKQWQFSETSPEWEGLICPTRQAPLPNIKDLPQVFLGCRSDLGQWRRHLSPHSFGESAPSRAREGSGDWGAFVSRAYLCGRVLSQNSVFKSSF